MLSRLETLPQELLLRIMSFLEDAEIAALQRVSKTVYNCARDNTLWRMRCFEKSGFVNAVSSRYALFDPEFADRSSPKSKLENKRYMRLMENWDPFFPVERPNWYDEYIQRYAPIQINWFQQPYHNSPDSHVYLDVRGVGLYHPKSQTNSTIAISPMADGSIYLWDVRGTQGKRGSIMSRSPPGSVFYNGKGIGRNGQLTNNGVVECVAVDSHLDLAFVAVESHLMHIDLTTLKAVSSVSFPWVISALSSTQPGVPLTVGTNLGIHMYDHRVNLVPHSEHSEKLDVLVVDDDESPGFVRSLREVLDRTPLPDYAPLPQSGPLSILHLEKPGQANKVSDEIIVTGRFSNILMYDRRQFKQMVGSIHSGARLCTLTSLPFSQSDKDQWYKRLGMLSNEQARASKQVDGRRTIIAAGVYNSKGSLELYNLLPQGQRYLSRAGDLHRGQVRNRKAASDSKILSATTHGSRIAFSDASGYVRWFERDAFTKVREVKLGHPFAEAQNSLFASMPGSDDVARKLLATARPGQEPSVDENDLLFWTGERLGLLRFSAREGITPTVFEEAKEQTVEELELQREQQDYIHRMGDALRQHANETRFLENLGCQ